MWKKIVGAIFVLSATILYATECICKSLIYLSAIVSGTPYTRFIVYDKLTVVIAVIFLIVGVVLLLLKDKDMGK